MSKDATLAPLQVLRESLRADSPVREASVAKLIAACCGIAIPFVFSLAFFQSWTTSLSINAFLAVVACYYLAQLRAMNRGWYHPAIAWANVLLEVSVPAVIVLMTALVRGGEYAHMTPTHVIWGGLVVASAVRATPRLSLVAGALAAAEWMALYLLVLVPRLPADMIQGAVKLPAAILRAVILMMCGGFAALIARHFIRKTEEALQQVRQQDLMGKYFLHERLGAGGMAEVWRATYCPEGGFQKPVAIKRVLPTFAGSEAFVEMFREEARLCASLNHPNIVQVFDCGRFKDSFILAMEYVDGLPLNRLLKRLQRPLPLNAVTYLASELANALDYIHRRVDAGGKPLNLVHRDVNPPNILLSRIGEVKLGDFGVANAATRVETGRTDIFYGKLHYAAPEQIVVGPFDGRADLFALGLTLIETLTLSRVYTAEDDASLNKGIFPRIPRPSELRQDIPPALEEVVMRLVTHDLNRRTPTGAELRAQLMKLEGLMAAYPGGQASLAAAVEEAILLGPADSKKAKVTQLPAKDGGEKLTAVFAREQARGQSSVSRSMPAKRKGPSIAGAAAPTANMRAIQTGKSARAPVSPANAQSTQALTSEELERALEEASSPKAKTPAPSSARSRKGSSPPAPVAHDSDEDTVQEMPPPPKSARTK